MNSKYGILTALFLFPFFLCSCDSEFSKYKKTDKNDLEKVGLIGKVKSVTRYYDGEIVDMNRYNRYGFITETFDYDDGEIDETITYTYNEFGKISREETKNKICHKADITLFDEYGNSIEESTEIYEVYDANSDLTVGKRLDYTYENSYDKMGGLINSKCLRRDGTCLSEKKYNQHGKISRIIEYNEDGSIDSYTDYSYKGNVLAEEKKTSSKSPLKYIMQYNQYGDIVKFTCLNEDGSIDTMREYVLDHKRNRIKEIETSVLSYSWRDDLKVGDILHFITFYERDEHGSTLKITKTTYYPYEDMSTPKEADEIKTFQYKYDSVGNVIYMKDYEGHEYKYEITYY